MRCAKGLQLFQKSGLECTKASPTSWFSFYTWERLIPTKIMLRRWEESGKKGCKVQENLMTMTVACTEAVVSYPPEVEDFLQFLVHSTQEDVRPGRPVFVHRWHRWHVLLQVQEILLHLRKLNEKTELCASRNGMFAIIPNIWWNTTSNLHSFYRKVLYIHLILTILWMVKS